MNVIEIDRKVKGKMVLDIENILKLNQTELLEFCYDELIKRKYKENEIVKMEDYIYAQGKIPILLVAHCDIVHQEPPQIIVNDRQQRILWSPTGIGGDDRCGVYAILKICEKFKPYLLFTTDEEKGGLGVRKFVKDYTELPVNFMIEIDRRGNNQVVFYRCGNEEFQNYILGFGFDKQNGSYSDVSTLSTELNIAGCNLSAGYYNEHTTSEHIIMEHLENTISKIKEILKDTKNHKFYDCQEIVYTPVKEYTLPKEYKYDYYDDFYYDDWFSLNKENKKKKYKMKQKQKIKELKEDLLSETDYILQKEEDYYCMTREEWKAKYKSEKPENVIDIY